MFMVVVDRLYKYNHFILLKHSYLNKTMAELFAKEIIRLHGTPKLIISDQDPFFIIDFWKELSSYHLKTDGQTEVLNR